MIDSSEGSGAGLAGQAGLVGKAAVVWLLLLAVLGIGVLDAVSIARTTLHASEVAAEAAAAGASNWRSEGRNVLKTCAAVAESIEAQDPSLKLGRNGCVVDDETGGVEVTIKTVADTIVAGRLGATAEYTQVVVVETAGQSKL
jgi:hypothetical protein